LKYTQWEFIVLNIGQDNIAGPEEGFFDSGRIYTRAKQIGI